VKLWKLAIKLACVCVQHCLLSAETQTSERPLEVTAASSHVSSVLLVTLTVECYTVILKFIKMQRFCYCWRFGFDWTLRRNGMVCVIAVRRSVSGRTGRLWCGRVDKTPRLCSSTCLAPSWYVLPPWSICPLCCLLCRWLWPERQLDRQFRRRLQSRPKGQQY